MATQPPPSDEIEGIGLDLGEILRIYLRRKMLMAAIVSATVALVTLVVYLVPAEYQAVAELMVVRNESEVSEGDYTRPVPLERGEMLATEAGIFHSEGLVLKVIAENKKLSVAPMQDDPVKKFMKFLFMPVVKLGLVYQSNDPLSGKIKGLAGRLDVDTHVDANLLTVKFTHDNPEVAQRALSTLIDTYLRYRIEIHRDGALEGHFAAQMVDAGERINHLEGQILHLESNSGMVLPDSEIKAQVGQISELRVHRVDAEIQRESLVARLDEIERLLTGREKEEVVRKEVSTNPAWSDLSGSITSLEERMAVMLTVYKEGSEPIAQVKAEIDAIRSVRDRTPENRIHSQLIARNDGVRHLLTEQDAALIDLAMADRRISALESAIDASRTRLSRMNHWASEMARADAERLALSNTFRVFLNKREASRLAQVADPSEVNVKVIHPPRVPDKPVMARLVPILASIFAGIALAFGLVTGLELVNGTVRNDRDVERALGVGILAEFPRVTGFGRRAS